MPKETYSCAKRGLLRKGVGTFGVHVEGAMDRDKVGARKEVTEVCKSVCHKRPVMPVKEAHNLGKETY